MFPKLNWAIWTFSEQSHRNHLVSLLMNDFHGFIILIILQRKISSAIGGLKRARPYVQQYTSLLIYYTLIQPLFDYCDVVWDNISKGLATKLQRLQNRAARVITNSSFDASATKIPRQQLGLESLDHRRANHKASVMFNVTNKKAPKYLTEMFAKVEEVNPYNLRNNEVNFYLPRPHTESLRKSFRYSGPNLWNALPLEVKTADTLSEFKRKLKSCRLPLSQYRSYR